MSELAKFGEKTDDEKIGYFFGPRGWLAVSADFEEFVARNIRSASTHRVLHWIFSRTKSGNRVNSAQKEIAEALGLSKAQVSRSFKELVQHGILLHMREDDDAPMEWFLSPQVGMRGSGAGQSWLNRRVAREHGILIPFDEKRRQKAVALVNP